MPPFGTPSCGFESSVSGYSAGLFFWASVFTHARASAMENATRDFMGPRRLVSRIAFRNAGLPAHASSRAWRRRRAFVTTETELKLIAAPAIIGLSSQPKTG